MVQIGKHIVAKVAVGAGENAVPALIIFFISLLMMTPGARTIDKIAVYGFATIGYKPVYGNPAPGDFCRHIFPESPYPR